MKVFLSGKARTSSWNSNALTTWSVASEALRRYCDGPALHGKIIPRAAANLRPRTECPIQSFRLCIVTEQIIL